MARIPRDWAGLCSVDKSRANDTDVGKQMKKMLSFSRVLFQYTLVILVRFCYITALILLIDRKLMIGVNLLPLRILGPTLLYSLKPHPNPPIRRKITGLYKSTGMDHKIRRITI